MPINRRKFLKTSSLAGAGMTLGANAVVKAENRPAFRAPADFKVTILATNWGFQGNFDAFCAKAKADGYDGVEVWLPGDETGRKELFDAVEKHGLSLGLLAGAGDAGFKAHLENFKRNVEAAAEVKPLFINCHSGRDYFSFEEGSAFIRFTNDLMERRSVPTLHETHRGRLLFAAHLTRQYLQAFPELRLTLDISHWCNVHESLLENQQETVAEALARVDHIHSRVGHQEGPQVPDPRAPEWKQALDAHFAWWDAVVRQKVEQGRPLTMTTEFGPPTYMNTVPYTGQPLADQWGVNVQMMKWWRERYGGKD
jgi:sugar phosphate isomerase/epimerase